jgi:hypothetical protein
MSKKLPFTIYIGYDPREQVAYDVCKFAIERTASEAVRIIPIKRPTVERMGLFYRQFDIVDDQFIDLKDGRPFSTDFSFTRFLVPALNMYEGWALYMDCDMYMRTDVNDLFEEYTTQEYSDFYPLFCVQHDYAPPETVKMDGKLQENYFRKNWSSFVLWNCAHPAHKKLTINEINSNSGSWLHKFGWLSDKTSDIGKITEDWNWLDGHSDEKLEAKNVHFTTGGPWFKNWNCQRSMDGQYAAEWNMDYSYLLLHGLTNEI